MIWDLGSANTSASIKSLLDSLEVEHIPHKRGHAWAKGGVEGSNNIVECLPSGCLVETHFNED